MENATHTLKPCPCLGAGCRWSSRALGQLQSQNTSGHESHRNYRVLSLKAEEKKSNSVFVNSPALGPSYIKDDTSPRTTLKAELDMFWLRYVKTNFLVALFSALGN